MNRLEARKRLLIAESHLNRQLLEQDVIVAITAVRSMVRTIKVIRAAGSSIAEGLTQEPVERQPDPSTTPSWWPGVLRCGEMLLAGWRVANLIRGLAGPTTRTTPEP